MTILITYEKCYCLCVLRWLNRPIVTLNCLLQMEQQRSEQDSSVGDALALALRCALFCSALLILFASYSLASLLMRPRHCARSCAICSQDSVGMLTSLREALRVSLYRFFDHHGSVCPFLVLHRGCFFGKRSSGILVTWLVILTVPVSEEYVHSASLLFSGLLCLESCLAT